MSTHAQSASWLAAGVRPSWTSMILETCDFAREGHRYRRIRLPRQPPQARLAILTDAEFDVAMRAARGESTKQIAQARKSSARTVDNQLGSAYRKLGVTCRGDLYQQVFVESDS